MDYSKIENLLAVEEIKNLRIKYTHALDKNDMEAASLIFSEDAICQTDRNPWNGRKEIKEGLQKAFNDYDKKNMGSYPFLHIISNHWVEVTGNTAKGSCYLLDTVTQREPEDHPLLLLGIYIDEYKKIDDKWYITKSELNVVWPNTTI